MPDASRRTDVAAAAPASADVPARAPAGRAFGGSRCELIVGPPGSGKTTAALGWMHEALAAGERVWWVGLPSQRTATYRRATEGGAVAGLEVLSSQQLYYRLLSQAARLRPLVVGTGRIALMGRALAEVEQGIPAPGEARLFTGAVAEAKRFGLGPLDLEPHDAETERLVRVFSAYERLKGARWDYDDYRLAAFGLLGVGAPEDGERWPGFAAGAAPDRIVFDGYRELGPLEVAIARGLAEVAGIPVLLALPEPPPGLEPDRVLAPRDDVTVERVTAANPVEEARWVLRSLKRDLAEGADPLDLAVILPSGDARAFVALADEYGVPLMDETPSALADTRPGRRLLDLLELAEQPTASRLLAVPDLQPLASAALERGVAGRDAMDALARELGMAEVWASWSVRLAPEDERGPDGGEAPGAALSWARARVAQALHDLADDAASLPPERFRDHALERAKEAATLATGPHFRAWWAALLQETHLFERPRGGVAVLGPTQASGRRFRRAYVIGAHEGAYSAGEREDYFTPEERRIAWPELFAAPGRAGLPRRFRGRDRALHAELLTRADHVVVSLAEGDQGGTREPEPALVGADPRRLPPVPAGSRLERTDGRGYAADLAPVDLGGLGLEGLRRYAECGFQVWAQRRTRDDDTPAWRDLVRDLRGLEAPTPADVAALGEAHPAFAAWLAEHAEALAEFAFGVEIEPLAGPAAYVDGAARSDGTARVLRFVAPGAIPDAPAARRYLASRWNEHWAAHVLLSRYGRTIERVHVLVWPIGGDPIDAYPGGVDPARERLDRLARDVTAAQARAERGVVAPSPGYRCRSCTVADVCRVGAR